MNFSSWVLVLLPVSLIVVFSVFTCQKHDECSEMDRVMVRGVFWYECVKR